MVRGAYLAMELTGWFVIVPLSLASLLTGLVQSLGTEWGLFRYYWILVKLVLTIGAATILLLHMPAVSHMSSGAAEVIHSGGGLLVLLATTALSVFKPWGRTGYGRRAQNDSPTDVAVGLPMMASTTRNERDRHITDLPLGLYILLGTIGLVLLIVIIHFLANGGHGGH
jgi:hypothetical protein